MVETTTSCSLATFACIDVGHTHIIFVPTAAGSGQRTDGAQIKSETTLAARLSCCGIVRVVRNAINDGVVVRTDPQLRNASHTEISKAKLITTTDDIVATSILCLCVSSSDLTT